LGFFSCAAAGLTPTSAVKPTAAALARVANTTRGEIALLMVSSYSESGRNL
jgi:hypothetical protein